MRRGRYISYPSYVPIIWKRHTRIPTLKNPEHGLSHLASGPISVGLSIWWAHCNLIQTIVESAHGVLASESFLGDVIPPIIALVWMVFDIQFAEKWAAAKWVIDNLHQKDHLGEKLSWGRRRGGNNVIYFAPHGPVRAILWHRGRELYKK